MQRSLNSAYIPASARVRRDAVIPPECRGDNFEEEYDYSTIVYDAIYFPKSNRVCLVCPKIYNLEALIRRGVFQSDQEKLILFSIRKRPRYDEIWLSGRNDIKKIYFCCDDFGLEIGLSEAENHLLSNFNAATLKSKNNSLEWIRDWAEYHQRVHNLQAIVLFDNGSNAYSINDIELTLNSVIGIKKFIVIEAPHRFGPRCIGRFKHNAKFFQAAILNIARLRFLTESESVLCTDVDELVAPIDGSDIFQETKKSLFGYTLFRGKWRHAPYCYNRAPRHRDHVYRRRIDACRNTKYCIAPSGTFGFSHWEVHGAVKGFLKNAMTSKRLYYIHCHAITTNWKNNRGAAPAGEMILDNETKDIMRNSFGKTHKSGQHDTDTAAFQKNTSLPT
jgi:hypothetical protein